MKFPLPPSPAPSPHFLFYDIGKTKNKKDKFKFNLYFKAAPNMASSSSKEMQVLKVPIPPSFAP